RDSANTKPLLHTFSQRFYKRGRRAARTQPHDETLLDHLHGLVGDRSQASAIGSRGIVHFAKIPIAAIRRKQTKLSHGLNTEETRIRRVNRFLVTSAECKSV